MPFDNTGDGGGGRQPARNVLGGALAPCSLAPITGFFRNGCCDTSAEDIGSHTVCVPGLRPNDRWCLCAPRWQEALEAGQAPLVVLEATHEGALRYCRLDDLRRHAAQAP